MPDFLPIITLLSDFGTADHYVSAMKGVILSIAPQARLVDVSHEVESQNVLSVAYLLANSLPWYPAGTIHLAVVDPGVGSDRRIIAGRWGDQIVIAPDNGLVSLVQQDTPAAEIYELSDRQYFRPEVSSTFHGRDIMAPVAAHLARGIALSALGAPIDHPLIIHVPQPEIIENRLVGQVIHVDRFGNLVTNIKADQCREFAPKTAHIKECVISFLASTYADVPIGRPLAVVGSSNMLEISVNQGSARTEFAVGVGEEIFLAH